jgi:DNA-binding transcriptional MocR family regulator
LPDGVAEKAVLRAAEREGIAFNVMGAYEIERRKRAGALILGYARNGEAVIEAGVRELAGVLARRKP